STIHSKEQLEFAESELDNSNFLDYFLCFDCNLDCTEFDYFAHSVEQNPVVEFGYLHSEDGIRYFLDYSLLRLLKHTLKYYLDILEKHCHRWQDIGVKDADHHK
ncbi:hypothetical protein Tco_0041409, partial [Tanacetum coccineum]